MSTHGGFGGIRVTLRDGVDDRLVLGDRGGAIPRTVDGGELPRGLEVVPDEGNQVPHVGRAQAVPDGGVERQVGGGARVRSLLLDVLGHRLVDALPAGGGTGPRFGGSGGTDGEGLQVIENG